MDSWILILLGVGAVIISAISKNKKEQQQGRGDASAEQKHSDEEEMSIPDSFSTIFGFSGYNEVEKVEEEVLETESRSFHDQFEEAVAKEVVEEVETESLYQNYQEVVAPVEEETVNMPGVTAFVKFDDNEITGEVKVKKPREKIDPRKMIIYSELLKPKYKEV